MVDLYSPKLPDRISVHQNAKNIYASRHKLGLLQLEFESSNPLRSHEADNCAASKVGVEGWENVSTTCPQSSQLTLFLGPNIVP